MDTKTGRIQWGFQSQNVALLVILVCLLIALFFLADRLFGAVGLNRVYTDLSYIVSPLMILGGLALLALWRSVPSLTSIVVGILFLVVLLALHDFLFVPGWLFALAVKEALRTIVPVAIAFTVLSWLLVHVKCYLLPSSPLRKTTIVVLLLSATFSLGVGATSAQVTPALTYNRYRALQYNNHFYFLSIHSSSDGETLHLYECNSLGMFCKDVYSPQRGYYSGETIALVPATNGVVIQNDSGTLYVYPSKSEKDSTQ